MQQLLTDCQKPLLAISIVGASIARPSKKYVFRISRREITMFSPCGDRFCLGKICGRPMVAPTDYFFDTLERAAKAARFFATIESNISGLKPREAKKGV